jgi:hypothetical protein
MIEEADPTALVDHSQSANLPNVDATPEQDEPTTTPAPAPDGQFLSLLQRINQHTHTVATDSPHATPDESAVAFGGMPLEERDVVGWLDFETISSQFSLE